MGLGASLIIGVLHVFFLSVCVLGKEKDDKYQICSPSSCGDIRNISYPFRLQGDPPSCGYPEYELICENNRTLTINLQAGKYYGKFLVTQINYHDYTIVVVDPGLKKGKCWISSPLHSIAAYYSTHQEYEFPYTLPYFWGAAYRYNSPSQQTFFYIIVLMKCEESVSHDDYIPIIPCNTTSTTSSSPEYVYAVVGDYVSVEDIPNSCTMSRYMVIQPLKALPKPSYLSMSDLQDYLLIPGLHLSFMPFFCNHLCTGKGRYCYLLEGNDFECYKWNNHIPNTSEKNCECQTPSYILDISRWIQFEITYNNFY